MSLPVHVDAYSGYKGSERPRQFVLDEDRQTLPIRVRPRRSCTMSELQHAITEKTLIEPYGNCAVAELGNTIDAECVKVPVALSLSLA